MRSSYLIEKRPLSLPAISFRGILWGLALPTRYLKPGIRDSEAIDALPPMAEVLFYRLIVTVDDFGRTDARASMVKAACFPIKDGITAAKCADLLATLAAAGLILLYKADGKEYLQMQKWDNIPRAKESKFPAPTDTCAQTYTDVRNTHTDVPLTVTETGTDNRVIPGPVGPRLCVPSLFDEFWAAYPKKVGKDDARKAFDKRKPDADLAAKMVAAVNAQKQSAQWKKDGGQYIPNPATWLNQGRWQDEDSGLADDLYAGAI